MTEVTDANGDEIAAARVTADQDRWSVTVPDLGYGEAVNVGFSATVSKDTAKTSITNTATAIDGLMKEPVSADAPIEIIRPALAIEKTMKPGVGQAGDMFDYTVKVNETDERCCAYNAIIEDDAPQGMELVADSVLVNGEKPDEGKVTVDAETNTWTVAFGDLAFGEEIVVDFEATVGAEAFGKTVTNTATATADYTDEVSDDAEIDVIKPVLSIVKDVDREHVQKNDVANYTVKIAQETPQAVAHDVVMTDPLPMRLAFADGQPIVTVTDRSGAPLDEQPSAQAKIADDGRSLELACDLLDENMVLTVAYSCKVVGGADGEKLPNTATASAYCTDEVSDDAVVEIVEPVLGIAKDASEKTVKPGEKFTYTINVTQTAADAVAHDTVVTDDVPEGVSIVGDVAVEGAENAEVTVKGNRIEAHVGDIAYKQQVTVKFEAKAGEELAGKKFTNKAIAQAVDAPEVSDDAVVDVPKDAPTVEKGKRGYDKTGADAGALAALVAALIASAAACGVYAYRNRREE